MNKLETAINEIYHIDRIATRDQWMNKTHPLVKFIVTIFYIILVLSFNKYDIIGLVGMTVYPIALFILADLSFKDAIKRLRIVLPLVCFIGIFNPIFDRQIIIVGQTHVYAGVFSMITLIMKGILAVLASYLLIATTTVEKICYALRLLHLPKVLVTQFMLTFRYVTVLLEEANRIMQAYSLRAPSQKGVNYKAWGSLAGQLLLRSIDRANVVYESMTLRGYNGDYLYLSSENKFRSSDAIYLLIWLILLGLIRKFQIITIAGMLLGGLF